MTVRDEVCIAGVAWPVYKLLALGIGLLVLVIVAVATSSAAPSVLAAAAAEYLDCMSAYGAAILGHAHPAVTEAIVRQAQTLTTCHQSFYNDQRARFLDLLMRHTPPGITRSGL